MDDVTLGDAVEAVAREGGPEAANLLTTLMERNRRDIEWAENIVKEGLERDVEFWKDRALMAEAELAAVQAAFYDMIHPTHERILHFKQYRQSQE